MKRRDLEKHLRAHNCELHHHGSSHDIWLNRTNQRRSPVPRHNELKNGTARGICRQLVIPPP